MSVRNLIMIDRLHIDKALVFWKSENTNKNKKKSNSTYVVIWDPMVSKNSTAWQWKAKRQRTSETEANYSDLHDFRQNCFVEMIF